MEKKNKTEFLSKGEIGVLIREFRGTSSWYPYTPMYEYLEVNAEIDRDTLQIKSWSGDEQWTYRLMRNEQDSLANWQGREQACRFFGEDNIAQAEKLVRKNLVNLRKNRKLAQENPVWLLLKPIADRVIKHYSMDFYHWDSLTLYDIKPEKFIWMVRECGTWLLCYNCPTNKSIVEHIIKNTDESHEFYWWNGIKAKQIELTDLAGLLGKLPKSE